MNEREKKLVAAKLADELVYPMDSNSGEDNQFEIAHLNLEMLLNRFEKPGEIMLESSTHPDATFSLLAAAYLLNCEEAFNDTAELAEEVKRAIIPLLEKEVEVSFAEEDKALHDTPLS